MLSTVHPASENGEPILSKAEIRALTGLRGVAATYVVFYHMHAYELCRGAVSTILRHGYLSVDLFFVLSGFVMALTYGRYFERGFSRKSYYKFMGRRLARVYPLYLVLTLIFFALSRIHNQVPVGLSTLKQVFANLLLIQAWGIAPSIIGPGWSISTELAAYVVFPALTAIYLFGSRRRAIVAGAICCLLLVAMAELPAHMIHVVRYRGPMDITEETSYAPVLRCVLEFILGLLAWRISRMSRMQEPRHSWPLAIVVVAMLGLLAVPGSDIAIILLLPVLIVGLSTDRPLIARALGSSIPHWLGEISYSIYLIHTLLLREQHRTLLFMQTHHLPYPGWLCVAVLLVVILGLAHLTYHFIEKPGRDLARRVLEPSPAPAPVSRMNLR